jgi:hypothetical protein
LQVLPLEVIEETNVGKHTTRKKHITHQAGHVVSKTETGLLPANQFRAQVFE